MTTATAEKTPATAPETEKKQPAELFRGEVAIGKIAVKDNIRKHFDQKKLEELGARVAKWGVLEPLLCRFNGDKQGYELIAGERRLRAAKLAKKETVPIRVLDVTPEEALEIQLSENIDREDLGPIEEARGFKKLLEIKGTDGKSKYTVETLAQRVDRSTAYVYRGVALLELSAPIIEAIEEGVLTPAHGLQLLRLPKEKRGKFEKLALQQKDEYLREADSDGERKIKLGVRTAKELQFEIDSEVGTNLSKAQFPKDVVYANEVACSNCPLNAANQGMLFDGATEGRCLNRPCFDKKTEQFYKDLQAEGAKKWPALAFVGRGRQNYYKKRSIEGCPGNAMLTAEEQNHAFIKKLLVEKPGKLGYAVVLPLERDYGYGQMKKWDKARLVMVVTDPPIIGGMETAKITPPKPEKKSKSGSKSTASSSTGSTYQEPKVDPKADFIEQQIDIALAKEVAAAITKDPLEVARRIAENEFDKCYGETDDYLQAAFGVDSSKIRKKIESSKSVGELLAIAQVFTQVDDGDMFESLVKSLKLKVDVAGIKKTAKAVAEKAWADKQAGEKAKAKK
jgi:ParB/RepB/Spo0J family partition protein